MCVHARALWGSLGQGGGTQGVNMMHRAGLNPQRVTRLGKPQNLTPIKRRNIHHPKGSHPAKMLKAPARKQGDATE